MSRWTPETDARLRQLLAEGLTASRVASALGRDFTRNMVIGRAGRIGADLTSPSAAATRRRKGPSRQRRVITLPGGGEVSQTRTHKNGNVARWAQARQAPRKPVEADKPPAPRQVPEIVPLPASAARGPVRLEDLRPTSGFVGCQCRWVIGEPNGFDTLHCGLPAVNAQFSWCEYHTRLGLAPRLSRRAS